jgi:ectoine hydroxylase-related dioxygenase (phytanoyl-CoA dioxygenase family)
MDLRAIAESYDRDGFVVVRGVLPPEDVRRIAARIDEFTRTIAPGLPPGEAYYEDGPARRVKAFHGMDRRDPYFADLRLDERLTRLVRAVWDRGEVRPGPVSFFGKPARDGSVTPPHQDNGFHHWHPPLVLELTIAIDESTPANGPLTCQAGTHKLGLLPHRPSGVPGFSQMLIDVPDTKAYPEVQICMKPGDVTLHHINVIHRSDANPSDRSRGQLGITYTNSLAAQDEEAQKKYRAEVERINQKVKASQRA